MNEFEQQYQCHFPKPDPLFEEFVAAWIRYHEAADLIDGHLPLGSPAQMKRARLATRRGFQAMGEVRYLVKDRKLFNKAKLEALRRLGK